MRNIISFCFLSILLSACSDEFFEQTIDIDPPEYEKQMVAHVLASNLDSAFSVPLTRNFGILDETPDSAWAVKNAVVELYEDGQLKQAIPYNGPNDQWYRIGFDPGFFQAGKTYELRATHPDFPTISAKQVMPGPFQIDSAVYRKNGGISSDGSELSAIDVYLKDQAGVKNYYVMSVEWVRPYYVNLYDNMGNIIGRDSFLDINPFYPESPEDPNVNLAARQTVAVNDQFFDGQPYKFSLRTYNYDDSYPDQYFRTHIWSVTEDYYLYLVSALRKADAEDLPLVEPVTVHSNLENGIGIFGLGWEEVRDIR